MCEIPRRPFIRALLIDLSGTLHIGSTPTTNAVEGLNQLRTSKIPFRFCSNTSKESTDALARRLIQMGFDIHWDGNSHATQQELWTSISVVKHLIRDMGLRRPYLLVSASAQEEILSEIQPPHEPNMARFDSVIIGLAPASLNYSNLNTAFRILVGEHQREHSPSINNPTRSHPHASLKLPLIATHKAKYIQTDLPVGLSLGPGPFVAALEHASGIQAYVVGKPTKHFFESVISDFKSDELAGRGEGRIAIIGDDVEADLGEGATELGLWRVLVRTGKYRPGDEMRDEIVPPDEVYDCFASFVDSLTKEQERKV